METTISKPNELVCPCSKREILFNGDILSARCPKNSSKVWRAIICGREVLKKVLVQCIGGGRDVISGMISGSQGPGTKTLVSR
jgi:hypothetical protein